jgi:hypothetical protein
MSVDARNHNSDFALALIAKGTGYFSHGKRNRYKVERLVFEQAGSKVQQGQRLLREKWCHFEKLR